MYQIMYQISYSGRTDMIVRQISDDLRVSIAVMPCPLVR